MFVPYSMSGYQQFVTGLLERAFALVSFDEFAPYRRIATLRHDVDAELEAAVAMAELESDLGIQSTYFLMLQSPLYNLFNIEFALFARRLADLGHWIGLYYDENFDTRVGLTEGETIASIFSQASQVQEVTGQKVRAVSFHQPSRAILTRLPDITPLISTYDFLSRPGYSYVADSNRSEGFLPHFLRLEEETKPTDSLQILVHPMWWFYSEKSPGQVWNRVIESNYRIAESHLLSTERAFGGKRFVQFDSP